MDDTRFDCLAKLLATRAGRRGLLCGASGGLAAALGLRVRGVGAGQTRRLLCHATGDPARPWEVIDVAEPAWQTGLARGDTPYHGCCADADCGAATPYCVAGTCVACRVDADCPDPGACHQATCDAGVCRAVVIAGAACDDGDPGTSICGTGEGGGGADT
jgi:hypothetical protein